MKTRTVLVTGAAGFIGSNFVRIFSKRFPKIKIVGVDDFSSGKKSLLDRRIIFYNASVADAKAVEKIFNKHRPEYVFHFAAMPRVSLSVEKPAETTKANIYGTALLLEKSRDYKVKRFVFSSSSSVYGGAKILPTKEGENPPNPVSPYALQKYAGELLCQSFGKLYGLESVCLRYFNVFGPGQYGDSPYSTVMSAWLERLYFPKKGQRPFLEGDGKQSRDFCFVDNAVEANILAFESVREFFGDVFNIAHGERTDLLAVKVLIEEFSGKKLSLKKRPIRLGDVRHTHADISKARKMFGYKPIVSFEAGLQKTVEWFKQRASTRT
ncbi:MAG: NAD-dependent epimerase/dehydratase [Parcubacteria group bacterium GW2011_GWA2_47_21]|nr:MAG: NAD-dependent epimerase/dehydratase [Parcubacteria group bacterium GW2011_GWA2_47_21]